jgi:two-component system response regulator DegU
VNGREALELCRELCPDLVLMDVRMPQMDGLEATWAIKREYPATSVLMVTTHESPEYLLDAIRAGAAGYVLKEATKHQLLDAVRRALSGEPTLDQELVIRLLRRLAGESDRKTEPLPGAAKKKRREEEPLPEPLTAKELEALRLLALGKTNREVAQGLRVSLSTVKAYVQRIIAKLEVSDRTQAAVRAAELGLLAEQEEE